MTNSIETMSVLEQLKSERCSFSGLSGGSSRLDCEESDDDKSVWDDKPGTAEVAPILQKRAKIPEQCSNGAVHNCGYSQKLKEGLMSLLDDMWQVAPVVTAITKLSKMSDCYSLSSSFFSWCCSLRKCRLMRWKVFFRSQLISRLEALWM